MKTIVRTKFGEVFIGTLKSKSGRMVVLSDARKILFTVIGRNVDPVGIIPTAEVPEIILYKVSKILPNFEDSEENLMKHFLNI